ncbi:MAG: type II secretion system GspH family protein [Lachnospiraceae bacterium]|nr:type II secretion system GspH family protein [Lachnospiraceae bacterium]
MNRKKINTGFTLVEMIAVLVIIGIMMSAAIWGITGWIEHYEYISSEEKARTVYMAAQSALSAAESRGVLDEYMNQIEKSMDTYGGHFAQSGESGLSKTAYGITTKIDNEGIEHKYGYLTVKKGAYGTSSNFLYDILETYISDKEQLNGSIVVEFDITAKKVYSAFYSGWETSLQYSDAESVERGMFTINDAHRQAAYREKYTVGYYNSDQVNVVKLNDMKELKVKSLQLHNEEKLYLTMNSTSVNNDIDTSFNIELHNKTGDKLCSFAVDRSMVSDVPVNTPKRIETDVFDENGVKLGKYAFVMSYNSGTDAHGEEVNELALTLDAVNTSQSYALMDEIDVNGRTDKVSYSITRLIGVSPMDIYANVSVEPKDAVVEYATGGSLDSNVENSLFATSDDSVPADTYEVAKIRHLSNIRYTEQYSDVNGLVHTYKIIDNLDWADGIIYSSLNSNPAAGMAYDSLDTTITGFPMIPSLGKDCALESNGKKISNLVIGNDSSVRYVRNALGEYDASPVNQSFVNGMIGINKGSIKGISFVKAQSKVLSGKNYKNITGNNPDVSIYSDAVQAAGILCGRSEGGIAEVSFDKDSAIEADVFCNLDDSGEEKENKLGPGSAGVNQRYASGVGMVAGTVFLGEDATFDKLYVEGNVKGSVEGDDNNYKDAPSANDKTLRKQLYSDTADTNNKTNIDYYSYGVGGVFGYVYRQYDAASTHPGIGDSNNTYSVVNKAKVEGTTFTGGIAGNIYMDVPAADEYNGHDKDGDNNVPDGNAYLCLINCVNYGDTKGEDYVGGIVGVNCKYSRIASCTSYGSPKASAGVSAGIVAENHGYVDKCSLERVVDNGETLIPKISGNMSVAGSITAVNHEDAVLYDCLCAVSNSVGNDDCVKITGNDMETFGFLVGENDGVVNKGRAGKYLNYSSNKTKLVIGGAVGTNKAVVKNVTVTFDFVDKGQANTVGGVVGENLGEVRKCYFGGDITKKVRSFADMSVGGIVARNGNGMNNGKIESCYIVGATFDVIGTGSFLESADENTKITKCSYVGGICAINNVGSTVDKCYITCLSNNKSERVRQSSIKVVNGMAGGIAAVNKGTVKNSGYTDKDFYEKDNTFAVIDDKDDMQLAGQIMDSLSDVSLDDTDKVMAAQKKLNKLVINDKTGRFKADVKKLCGYIPDDKDNYKNALSKSEYDISDNDFILTMNKGVGCIGGIAGYNASTGTIKNCASGRWVVENYLPKVKYIATGGVVGENASDGKQFNHNINFAYVRTELSFIPDDDSVMNDHGQVHNKNYNHNFYYVGGVVGTQNNLTNPGWTIEKCVNVGTVVNYFGNNVGGVICRVKGNGGNVGYCYNYGKLMAGYTNNYGGGFSGTAGGIVSHYTELKSGQTNDVYHCVNQGVVGMPALGFDSYTNKIVSRYGNDTANDVGGIVGEISAPEIMKLYVVNIKDCINGHNASVYAHSKSAGILGTIGCYANEGNQVKQTVNSIFVNIDKCRNYSSNIISAQGAKTNEYYTGKNGGILSGRDPYAAGAPKIGYTAVKNCFSVRMQGYDESSGNYTFRGGAIAYYKTDSYELNEEPYRVYGDNYYMDEYSFQYSNLAGLIGSDGFRARVNNNVSTDIKGVASLVDAFIANAEPVSPEKISSKKYIDKVDKISKHIKSSRLITVTYDDGKYAIVKEPDGYDVTKLNKKNAWIVGDDFYISTVDGVFKYPVMHKFSEDKNATPYSNKLLNHFYLDRAKKYESYKTIAVNHHNGANLDDKLDSSRTPVADEYDLDYFKLDSDFIKYIDKRIAEQDETPDKIKNVDVTKSKTSGKYSVSWEVVPDGSDVPTATEFDVEIRYVELPISETFDKDKLGEYESNNRVRTENTKAYGTTILFNVPDDYVMTSGNKYYAVVRVRDARASKKANADDYYSEIMDTESIKSYIALEPKLPQPKFEIVSYSDKWMLHLLNPDDFKDFVNNADFEVGVYIYKDNTTTISKTVKLTKDNIVFTDDATYEDKIMQNAVPATDIALGKEGEIIYCYAKAEGCLEADVNSMMVYIPKNATAKNMAYELQAKESHLDSDKPTYSGTLSYTYFDKWNNTDITPNVPQVFRVELYGVVKGKDAENNDITWHETIAMDEYAVNVGESVPVEIGYYSSQSGADLTKYESFGIDCWYAASGQGDVYNYVETNRKWAEHKTRSTGFITDVSVDASKPTYYFHSVKLNTPHIELVCMGREPLWYARLLNREDYEGTGAGIRINNKYTIDVNSTDKVGNVLPYACKVNSGSAKYTYKAIADGFYDSATGSLSNSNIVLQTNLSGNTKVNLAVDCDTYKDSNNVTSDGCFALDGNNKLTFKGRIRYNSHGDIDQYYRYEIYALDDKDQQVTLLLSDDIKMDSGNVNTGYKTEKFVTETIDDVSGYHDFHFAVWYSKCAYSNADKNGFVRQYFEITEEEAKALAYDTDKDNYVDAREKGVLIDKSGTDVKYYYVTPLADKRYQTLTDKTNDYDKYVLYRELEDTISGLKAFDDGSFIKVSDGDVKVISWNIDKDFYDKSNVCDVDVKIYEVSKSDTPTVASLQGATPFVSDVVEMKDSYLVRPIGNKTYDWDNHNYVALVRVKDKNMTDDTAYTEPVLVKVSESLKKPELSILLLGDEGQFVRLDNPEDYDENAEIVVTLEGCTIENIKLNGGTSYPRTTKYAITIPYSVLRGRNQTTGGKLSTLKAYAVIKGTGGEADFVSEMITKKVYMPSYTQAVPNEMRNVKVENASAGISGNNVTFSGKVSFKTNAGYKPVCEQCFCVALTGTPVTPIDGFDQEVILTRMTPDQYIKLTVNQAKEINVTLNVDASVDLSKYTNLNVCIWYAGACAEGSAAGCTDGFVYEELELTKALFDTYKTTAGVTIDYTNGVGNEKYFLERAFYDAKEGYPFVRGTSRVSIP